MMLYVNPSIKKCNVCTTLENAGIYGAVRVAQEYYQRDANIYKMATVLWQKEQVHRSANLELISIV